MVIPSVTCRIAALSLSGFFVPKAVLYYWKFQRFFFLIPYKSRFAFKRKKKLVNSLALIANTSLPISTAFDRNASNKHVKASISFMPLLSWFFIAVFSPWSCRTPLFPSWGLSRAVLLSGSAGPCAAGSRAGTAVREQRRAIRRPPAAGGHSGELGLGEQSPAFHS